MNTFSNVPPGFRFHPTDEELVDYYLRKKVASKKIDLDVIKDVDLYKIEPWDLQDKCRIGAGEEEQSEWYFFSHKDRKYPTGSRTNRATAVGFWKATGRDKPIYKGSRSLVGMRKTLVFYRGRAPNGRKSDFIMHEYRLETGGEHGAPQEEGWVVCRVFKKQVTSIRRANELESPYWFDDQISSTPELDLPYHHLHHHLGPYSCKQELDLHHHLPYENFHLQLPQLESPTMPVYIDEINANILQSNPSFTQLVQFPSVHSKHGNVDRVGGVDQVTDWRVLDRFVASQLSQDDGPKESNGYPSATDLFQGSDQHEEEEGVGAECPASTSNSSCHFDLWK